MFTEFDRSMMALALEEAELAKEGGDMAVGAVIVKGRDILARAHNTREAMNDPAGHAEINALRQAAARLNDWRLNGCVMYVTLEPCAMCAGAIAQARLDRLIFGAYDEGAGCCASVYRLTEDPIFGSYVPSDGGLMADSCARLLKSGINRNKGSTT